MGEHRAKGVLSGYLFLVWLCLFGGVGSALLPKTEAREIRITILATTDIHGHLLPTKDYNGNQNVGGLLRCASAIQEIRLREPNVLYVDCGDLIQGAAESGITRGQLVIRALEWLRCDAWVLGNHDFDWGLHALTELLDRTRIPVLAANVIAASSDALPLPKARGWILKEVDGTRIVFVGLTTPGTPAWLTNQQRQSVIFEDSVDALRRIMPAVRAVRPDIMVLLIHQGLPEFKDDHANELLAITQAFPEWDVIIGGHTHKVIPGTRVNKTLFLQAGYYANWLGRIDITYDNVSRSVTDITSSVIEIGTNWCESHDLCEYLGHDLKTAQAKANQLLGYADTDFSTEARHPGLSALQDLIARAVAWKVGAEAVLVGEYGEEMLHAGPISVGALWRVIPYENEIGLLSVTPAELRMILDENLRWMKTRHFLGLWGMLYDIEKTAPNQLRTTQLRWMDGRPVHGRSRIRLAVSSYALASAGRRYSVLPALARRPECRLQMTGIDTRSAVIEYVRKAKRVAATTQEEVATGVRER